MPTKDTSLEVDENPIFMEAKIYVQNVWLRRTKNKYLYAYLFVETPFLCTFYCFLIYRCPLIDRISSVTLSIVALLPFTLF